MSTVVDVEVITGPPGPPGPPGPVAPFVGAKVFFAGSTFGTASYIPIPFAGERWDTDGFHDPDTNSTRLMVPAGLGGRYRFDYVINHASAGYSYIRKNGSVTLWTYAYISGATICVGGGSSVITLLPGDYIEVMFNAPSGIMQAETELSLQRVG